MAATLEVRPLLAIATAALLIPLCLGAQNVQEARFRVIDKTGTPRRAVCEIFGADGHSQRTSSDEQGQCDFHSLSAGNYGLRVASAGFKPANLRFRVPQDSTTPVAIVLQVAGANATIDVTATVDPISANASTIGSSTIRKQPATQPARELVGLVLSQPGWLLEANGVLHPRGSEYDTQYVIDGVPVLENRSPAFAPPIGTSAVESMHVETGGYPAAYGRKLGGVVEIDTFNRAAPGWHGSAEFGSGSFRTESMAVTTGIATTSNSVNLDFSGARTTRFLDPPTIDPLHDSGATEGGGISFAHDFSRYRRLRINFRKAHTGLDVPNELQQEVAGQQQTSQLDDWSSTGWYQQVLSPNLLLDVHTSFRQLGASLVSDLQSRPIAPNQERQLSDFYASGALTAHRGNHDFSFGSDFIATRITERFSYLITDPSIFDPAVKPSFAFADRASGRQTAAYFQDRFSRGPLTVSAGLRYDYYQLLLADQSWSPRLAAALNVRRLGVVLHGSYDRIFNTPATENLLLASSAAVRDVNSRALRLPVPPARANFFEVGLAKSFHANSRIDVSAFRRDFRNFHDDDVFLNTGLSFPISFASAMIEGIEAKVHVVLPRHAQLEGNFSNLSGIAQFPVTGGLFLEANAKELLDSTDRFRITQDQRNSATLSLHCEPVRRLWLVTSATYGSGLPVELDDSQNLTTDSRILERVNFARGRLRPSYSIDAAVGAIMWHKEARTVEAAASVTNLTDHLNVINFAGVFSGTAIGAPRSLNGKIRLTF